MNRVMILAAALLAFVNTQSCNPVGSGDGDIVYPTTIRPMETSGLEALRQRFEERNGPRVCFEMDEYGFLKFASCWARPILRAVISEDSEVTVSKAKRMLFENREFTGVTDTSALVVLRLNDMPGCILCDGSPGDIKTIRRGIDFENQVYLGLEILDSRYSVALDSVGVTHVVGHWYEGIAIPPTDRWNEEKAKQSIVGKSIIWYGFGGDKHTFEVSPDDLLNRARKVILQHQVGENIELRVAWEMPVGKGVLMWNVYVDTTTGEDLGTMQLFMT